MRIAPYLRPDLVAPKLSAHDLEGVLHELAALAGRAGLGDARDIGERLIAREREHTTVVGRGLAIPHATVPGLPAPVLAVGLSAEGVAFGPEDMDPVRVFFLLLSPPGHERDHVKVLARICRLARHPGFLGSLTDATLEAEVVKAIQTIDDQHV